MPRPIETAPKDGQRIFVGDDHGTIAKVFWHGMRSGKGFWAYWGNGTIAKIDFEPTRWAEDSTDFERD